MKSILKQSVGIDCSKDELVVCFHQLTVAMEVVCKATEVFTNNERGFKHLFKWSHKLASKDCDLLFVVEATGVYHERLAHFLFDHQCRVSIVLPNKAKHFAQTLSVKTVTDKVASKTLSLMGIEKKLDLWQKPDEVYEQLRQLTREREQLIDQRTISKNQLHAEQHQAHQSKPGIRRLKALIRLFDSQIEEVEKEMTALINKHPELKKKMNHLCSVPGIGLITATTLIAETHGFHLIRNAKQLVSYAGLDVVDKQSGTSVRGKPHISGKGNSHIRKCLYFPAFNAVRYIPVWQKLYQRLVDKNGVKMKAYTAVMRKLLVITYVLWKKQEDFDKNYQQSNTIKFLEQPQTEAALTELDRVRS
jgi:transposase